MAVSCWNDELMFMWLDGCMVVWLDKWVVGRLGGSWATTLRIKALTECNYWITHAHTYICVL